MQHCGLQPPSSSQYGMVVHSHNDYFGPISFPAVAELGLRVNQLGRSSVRYEIALFEQGVEEVKAVGEFVHVFVDRATKRPATNGMPHDFREGLRRILVQPADSKL
jgi:acyl-CoA thioester hydrolase